MASLAIRVDQSQNAGHHPQEPQEPLVALSSIRKFLSAAFQTLNGQDGDNR
jgi:hypothetical protein